MISWIYFIGLVIILLLLLLFAMGVGEILFRGKIIKQLKDCREKWSQIELMKKIEDRSGKPIKLGDLGALRIEEISTSCSNPELHEIRNKATWEVSVIVWYKERSLSHHFEHLRKVSSIFFALTILGIGMVLIHIVEAQQSISFNLVKDRLMNEGNHLVPILELVTFIIILLQIAAELNSIKELLKGE